MKNEIVKPQLDNQEGQAWISSFAEKTY